MDQNDYMAQHIHTKKLKCSVLLGMSLTNNSNVKENTSKAVATHGSDYNAMRIVANPSAKKYSKQIYQN